MGTKYSSVSVASYNANPPSDDGSTTESNKVKWSTHKSKLTDPIKTALESINTALVTALDSSARAVTASDTAASSDHDKTIQVTSASVVITLSDAATMAAGYKVTIANQSTGNISVALATSSNTIDTVTNAAPVLSAKEVREYIVNAAATGYITKNGVQIPFTDSNPVIVGSADNTKKVAFEVDGLTTGTTRTVTVPNKNGTMAMTSDIPAGITLGTEQASTSGTSIDFTGIPAGTKRITIMFVGVSTNGTDNYLVQLGDAGGFETTGYTSACNAVGTSTQTSSSGFLITPSDVQAAAAYHGKIVLTLEDSSGFTWVSTGNLYSSGGATTMPYSVGTKSLSAELTQVRITTSGGTNTFDAGAINIQYE